MRHTALFLPSHSVIGAHKIQYKIPVGVIQAIRVANCVKNDLNSLIVMPKGTKVNTIEEWDADLMIPIEVDLVRDQLTGAGTYSEDLHKYLTTRRSPLPYDIVISWNTQMTVGMQRMLRDGGYGGTEVPVITHFEITESMTEWKRNPAGEHSWVASMEVLEAFCSYFGPCIFSSPYNADLFKRQLRKIMSPAYQRVGLKNIYHQWRPEKCPSDRYLHKWNESKPFYLIIAGGFGLEREGIPKQGEITIEAVKKLQAMGKNVKLIVCSTSSETEWTKKVLKGALEYVDYYLLPANYAELWKKAHCGIALREVDEGPKLVFTEFMMSGKPVIWLRNKYMEGWADPEGLTPYCMTKMTSTDLVYTILKVMDTYKTASKNAYTWGEGICLRHKAKAIRDSLMPLIDSSIVKAEETFNCKNFKVFAATFEKLNKEMRPIEFDLLYRKLNEACGKSFGMYSRLWVAKMLKRYSNKQLEILPKGRKLCVCTNK